MPSGLSFSVEAAKRGHEVTLFDRGDEIEGSLILRKWCQGKKSFMKPLDTLMSCLKNTVLI